MRGSERGVRKWMKDTRVRLTVTANFFQSKFCQSCPEAGMRNP